MVHCKILVSEDHDMKNSFQKKAIFSLLGMALLGYSAHCSAAKVVAPARDTRIDADAHYWPIHRLNISSGYGPRFGAHHKGIDLAAAPGTPVYASAAGTVEFAGWERMGYGWLVIIEHGNGVRTYYAHNSKNLVRTGQVVMRGQQIARVGKTGFAMGNHLHFEYRIHNRAIDPRPFMSKEILAAN